MDMFNNEIENLHINGKACDIYCDINWSTLATNFVKLGDNLDLQNLEILRIERSAITTNAIIQNSLERHTSSTDVVITYTGCKVKLRYTQINLKWIKLEEEASTYSKTGMRYHMRISAVSLNAEIWKLSILSQKR